MRKPPLSDGSGRRLTSPSSDKRSTSLVIAPDVTSSARKRSVGLREKSPPARRRASKTRISGLLILNSFFHIWSPSRFYDSAETHHVDWQQIVQGIEVRPLPGPAIRNIARMSDRQDVLFDSSHVL